MEPCTLRHRTIFLENDQILLDPGKKHVKRHGIILPGKSDGGQVGLVLLAVYPDLLLPGARQHQDLAPTKAGQADRSHRVAVICHNSLQAVGQQAPELDLNIILELRIVSCNLVHYL